MNMDAAPENIWIEVEVHEDADGLTCYSGLASYAQVQLLLNPDPAPAIKFLQLDHVFWTRTKKETEWAAACREVVEYGKGSNGNYLGPMYVRVDRIILISELKGGAELQRKYIGLK